MAKRKTRERIEQVIIFAVIAALLYAGTFVIAALALHVFDGTLRGVALVGDTLIVGETVSVSGGGEGSVSYGRLVTIDARNGRALGRVAIDGDFACAPADATRAFCDGGLMVLTVPSNTVLDLEDAIERAGFGADYEKRPRALFDRQSNALVTRALDGQWLDTRVDGSVRARSAPPPSDALDWPDLSPQQESGPTDLIAAWRLTAHVPAGQTWVTSRASMAEDARFLVTRRVDGTLIERVPLGTPGNISAVVPHAGNVVLVVYDPDGTRLIALGADGHVRWRSQI